MWKLIHSVLLTMLFAMPMTPALAQEPADDGIRELDEQVQDIKAEMLDIAIELSVLEQQLLYPSGTRATLSFSITPQAKVRPNATEVRVDSHLVAHHIYSQPELQALQNGGIQNLYTGNVSAGKHELQVRITGTLADGTIFDATEQLTFTKGVESKTLDITLDQASGTEVAIRITDR